MEQRHLGRLSVSLVGLGCNNFGMRIDEAAAADVVQAALDAGVTYFDTADIYGGGKSEVFLGRALGSRRDEAVVATKWGSGIPDGERRGRTEAVRRCCDASLSALGVEVIDHYQMHRPDPDTPIAETLGTLEELRCEGKIREIGCSNFSADQLHEMMDAAAAGSLPPFATVQNHYSMLTRTPETDGVLEACRYHGIGFVPYFPLEAGLLTGKYRVGEELPADSRLAAWSSGPAAGFGAQFLGEEKRERAARLQAWAEGKGHSVLALAMSWLAAQPGVATIIAGATKPSQVNANAAGTNWLLNADELAEVDAVLA